MDVINRVGNILPTRTRDNPNQGRVYDVNGIAPTIISGGQFSPYIIEKHQKKRIVCEQRTDEGIRLFKNGICGTLRTTDCCGDKRIIEIL